MQETHFQILKQYIQKAYEANISEEQIIQNLTTAGWQQSDVMVAIRSIKSEQVYSNPVISVQPVIDQTNSATQDTPEEPLKNRKYQSSLIAIFNRSLTEVFSNFWMILGAAVLSTILLVATYTLLIVMAISLFGLTSGFDSLGYFALAIMAVLYASPISLFITVLGTVIKESIDGAQPTFGSIFRNIYKRLWAVMIVSGIIFAMISVFPLIARTFIIDYDSVFTKDVLPVLYYLWQFIVSLLFIMVPLIVLFSDSPNPFKAFITNFRMISPKGRLVIAKMLFVYYTGLYVINYLLPVTLRSQINDLNLVLTIFSAGIFGIFMSIIMLILATIALTMLIVVYTNEEDPV